MSPLQLQMIIGFAQCEGARRRLKVINISVNVERVGSSLRRCLSAAAADQRLTSSDACYDCVR